MFDLAVDVKIKLRKLLTFNILHYLLYYLYKYLQQSLTLDFTFETPLL